MNSPLPSAASWSPDCPPAPCQASPAPCCPSHPCPASWHFLPDSHRCPRLAIPLGRLLSDAPSADPRVELCCADGLLSGAGNATAHRSGGLCPLAPAPGPLHFLSLCWEHFPRLSPGSSLASGWLRDPLLGDGGFPDHLPSLSQSHVCSALCVPSGQSRTQPGRPSVSTVVCMNECAFWVCFFAYTLNVVAPGLLQEVVAQRDGEPGWGQGKPREPRRGEEAVVVLLRVSENVAKKIIGRGNDTLPDALALKTKNADCFSVYTRLTGLSGWRRTVVYHRRGPSGRTSAAGSCAGGQPAPLRPLLGHSVLFRSLSAAVVFHLTFLGLRYLVCEMGFRVSP